MISFKSIKTKQGIVLGTMIIVRLHLQLNKHYYINDLKILIDYVASILFTSQPGTIDSSDFKVCLLSSTSTAMYNSKTRQTYISLFPKCSSEMPIHISKLNPDLALVQPEEIVFQRFSFKS